MKNTFIIVSALACTAGTAVYAQQAPTPAAPSAPAPSAEAPPAPPAAPTPAPAPKPAPAPAPASAASEAPAPKVCPTVPHVPTAAERKAQQTLQQVVDDYATKGMGALMMAANKAFPEAAGVAVSQDTKIVDGRGQRTVTATITDKEGKSTAYTLICPVSDQDSARQAPGTGATASMPATSPAKVQGPHQREFSDGMAEAMLQRATAICDLLAGVHDKDSADAAAPQLEKQCLDLENMLEASRRRNLPQRYVARMIKKYNGAMEAGIGKMESLITGLAAKDYYGSSALKEVAEKFCR